MRENLRTNFLCCETGVSSNPIPTNLVHKIRCAEKFQCPEFSDGSSDENGLYPGRKFGLLANAIKIPAPTSSRKTITATTGWIFMPKIGGFGGFGGGRIGRGSMFCMCAFQKITDP